VKSSEITLKMNGFLPLSDIQKMLNFTPIKTYRLFKKFVRQNKLPEISGWIRRDNQILIDISQFYALLDSHGYKNFLRDDFKRFHLKSNDNQVISNEITGEEVDEEFQQPEPEKVKSNDFNMDEVKSNDFNRNQLNTNENQNSNNNDIKLHREIIDTLRDSLERSEKEADILREQVRNLSGQNTELSRQNVQLTYVLVAPKKEDKNENNNRMHANYDQDIRANNSGETIYASAPHTEPRSTTLDDGEKNIETASQSTPDDYCVFHAKVATHSTVYLPLIPRESCH
jgi:hypothetical protein